jgi:hypothetical protein
MPPQYVFDRDRLGLLGLEEIRGPDDFRADVKPDRPNQHPEEIRDPPSPTDQLVVGQQRRQGDAEQ